MDTKNSPTIMIMGFINSIDETIIESIKDANNIGEFLKERGYKVIVPGNEFSENDFSFDKVDSCLRRYNSQIKNADFVFMLNSSTEFFLNKDYNLAANNKKPILVRHQLESLMKDGPEKLRVIHDNIKKNQEIAFNYIN